MDLRFEEIAFYIILLIVFFVSLILVSLHDEHKQ